ncbi:MAG: FAD-dependent oxidoreductase [Gammaproteobacteria bacterium]|nr:FAD-dependent oxidoreductase [Gammaproteobacteria bacterium]
MRIAIIGSGISGLVAAHHLHRDHDITIFEAADHAGGHTHTVDVEADGRAFAVDTGFIVFNDRNYPHFSALLRELGVAAQPGEMGFSMRCDESGLEYSGTSLNTLFAQRMNLLRASFHRMLFDIMRLNRHADELVACPEGLPLGTFLDDHGFSGPVVDDYLLPMAGAIWSAEPAAIMDFPARHFGRFFRNHGLLDLWNRPQWRTVAGGSREYVRAITRSFAHRLRLSTPVERVTRLGHGVRIEPRDQPAEDHDAVIFACHSDEALATLADPTDTEREVLGAIPYQENTGLLHTDERLLPRRHLARAAWNYHRLPSKAGGINGRVTVTYNLTALQRLPTRHQFLVTLNAPDAVDPARVIRRMNYSHPVYNARSMAAQQRWAEINGQNRSYFCGAYWGYGFHEDGVLSGMAVARAINGQHVNEQLHLRRLD